MSGPLGLRSSMRLLVGLGCVLASATPLAAESTIELTPITPNLQDKPSLQRGMALYANYCLACHSLKFQRYERTADDLGIPHDVATQNLIFTGEQLADGQIRPHAIGTLMDNAMPPEKAKNWFGAPPPDLTMVDRVRGTDWVYNMLKNFYVDDSRPFGVNNRVSPNIGMPHVLIDLQGTPRLTCRGYKPFDILDGEDALVPQVHGTELEEREPNCSFIETTLGDGTMSEAEFDQAIYDIANFLHYVGDPGRTERHRLGYWVLGFLALLFVVATLLSREYWKDVH